MSQILKLKRGNAVNLGSLTLEAGEPAFVLDTGKLYVGDGTDKILINPDGGGYTLPIASSSTLGGIKSGADITVDGNGNVAVNDNSHNHTSANISDATNSNTASTIVKRDASGNFSAGTITASLSGNATTATSASKLTTARTISLTGDVTGSVSFDGSGNASMATTYKNSGVTAGTYTKVTVDAKGNVTTGTSLSASDIPSLTLSKITDAGTAASKNTGTLSGNIPVLDSGGKLDSSVLPAIAITNTFVVATQTAMLALTAEVGDIAVRTDLNKSFILKTDGASTLANWQELLTPTDTVTSVAGKTGVVTLTSSDVGLGNVINTKQAIETRNLIAGNGLTGGGTLASDRTFTLGTPSTITNSTTNAVTSTSHTHALTVTATDVGLENVTNESKTTMFTSPTFTGVPVAPTATAGTNTTQLATTAFVTTAVANKTSITGNAGTATKLQTARTIAISGGATGTATSFNGSANISIPITSVDATYLSGTIDGGTF